SAEVSPATVVLPSLNRGLDSPQRSSSSPSSQGLFHGFLGLDVDPQFQVLPELLPADLEDRPPLAEMEVLQRHRLDQLRELELGQLVKDVGPLVTVRLRIGLLHRAHGPDFQDVALAILVVVVGGLGSVDEPASRSGAREQRHPLLQPASVLVAHRGRASPCSSAGPAWSRQVAPHSMDYHLLKSTKATLSGAATFWNSSSITVLALSGATCLPASL